MSVLIPTPTAATFSKTTAGISDCSISGGVYKFLGSSILAVQMSLGFNGTPSSLTVTLVDDVVNGDFFLEPTIPSLMAFSLPLGGVGAPIFYADGTPLSPNSFANSNVPFYFCGVCTNWTRTLRDVGGILITVTLVDARELLRGVQCLLGGFALSHNVGGGLPRYSNVNNIIDVFGYYNYGMESGKNQYGMQWSKIKDALEAVKVTVNNIEFEFYFTGETFINSPDFYRLDDQIIDVCGLCQKVCEDSGSDYITIARKSSITGCVVEFRGIKRTNGDSLTLTDIQTFVNSRNNIVERINQGKEYRNEPTSAVVIGGMQNSNYTALPSTYDPNIHLRSGQEDYNSFPIDIKTRLFGGNYIKYTDSTTGPTISQSLGTVVTNAGAIFPFWGFTPDDHAYPLLEPFLPLDHLVFDQTSNNQFKSNLKNRLPICATVLQNYTVRSNIHSDIFLTGDGASDSRPFAVVSGYFLIPSGIDMTIPRGYMRGLPLNTEVLRASLATRETFFGIYNIHYPDIAAKLGMPRPNFNYLLNYVSGVIICGDKPNIESSYTVPGIGNFINSTLDDPFTDPVFDIRGTCGEDAFNALPQITQKNLITDRFLDIIHEAVKAYAQDYMGKRFLVCLPRSEIMQRIWAGLPVPTNTALPDIEYVIDQVGYWKTLPAELNPSGTNTTFTSDEVDQIRRKFMAQDTRFYAMIGIDWVPSGNCNFNSNGLNHVMFQDFNTDSFRPNRIASTNPKYVLASCSVNSLRKRPDLAIVEMERPIYFRPVDGPQLDGYQEGQKDEFIATKTGIIKYLWYQFKRDSILRRALDMAHTAINDGSTYQQYATRIVNAWAEQIRHLLHNGLQQELSTEPLMDFKGVIIPLTSTWVSYGPYYSNYTDAKGMVDIIVDDNLVPWNFPYVDPNGILYAASGWSANLDAAGRQRLARTLAIVDYLDTASITVAGFPEYGPGMFLGYNSNITGISVDFGINGVKTVYNLASYNARPGTYRKEEYDNVTKARVDLREQLPQPININVVADVIQPGSYGRDRFLK